MLKQTIRVTVLLVIFCGAACAEEYVVWGVGMKANIEGTDQPTVVRSGNTGASWSYVGRDGQLPGVDYSGVAAVNSQTVWIAGDVYDGYGTIYRTDNSGSTWTRIGMNNPLFEGIGFNKMRIVGEDIWVMGSTSSKTQYLYHSSDNGTTWTNTLPEAYQTVYSFQGLGVAPDGTVWLVGGAADGITEDTPIILKSVNDGGSWTSYTQAPLTDLQRFLGVTSVNSETAWAIGRGAQGVGGVFGTTIGSQGWVMEDHQDFNDGNEILAVDENVIWATYDYNVRRTTDGGGNWESIDGVSGTLIMGLTACSADMAFCSDIQPDNTSYIYTIKNGAYSGRTTQIGNLNIPSLWQMDMVPVPEPATAGLLTLAALAVLKRKRKA